MRLHVIGLIAVLTVGGMLTAQPDDKAPPGDTDAALEKKLKELRDQIDELKRKHQSLESEKKTLLEKRNAKEDAAEKKKHYAKMEIRGKLVRTSRGNNLPGTWHVVINDLTWGLNFGDKKELQASAEKLLGKGVIITGVLVNKKAPVDPSFAQTNPGNPFPVPLNPGRPHSMPIPYYHVEGPPTINVESLTAAKD